MMHSLASRCPAGPRRFRIGLFAAIAVASVAGPTRLPAADEDSGSLRAENLSTEQLAAITRPDPERPLPFQPGEKLIYKIGWGWFDVGRAELTLTESVHDGSPAWKMELVARTNSFADTFYKVRNTTTAWISPDFKGTLHVEADQREGSRERKSIVEFDPQTQSMQFHNLLKGDSLPPVTVLEGTWDPMGITYFVRSLALAVGDDYVIPTSNGKEFFLTQVSVVKRERRRFRSGRQDAFLLKPNIKDLGGVFQKSDNASVTFWFSADERRVPLRMESAVAVGSFWAELVDIEQVADDED